MSNESRDIEADYKAALLREYESYVQAGRKAAAADVAKVLKKDHGHDVDKSPKKTAAKKAAAPERADVKKPPEKAVQPKPQHKD